MEWIMGEVHVGACLCLDACQGDRMLRTWGIDGWILGL